MLKNYSTTSCQEKAILLIQQMYKILESDTIVFKLHSRVPFLDTHRDKQSVCACLCEVKLNIIEESLEKEAGA